MPKFEEGHTPIYQKKNDKMTIIYKILYRKLNIEQKESI
jgi:hypothetical protein